MNLYKYIYILLILSVLVSFSCKRNDIFKNTSVNCIIRDKCTREPIKNVRVILYESPPFSFLTTVNNDTLENELTGSDGYFSSEFRSYDGSSFYITLIKEGYSNVKISSNYDFEVEESNFLNIFMSRNGILETRVINTNPYDNNDSISICILSKFIPYTYFNYYLERKMEYTGMNVNELFTIDEVDDCASVPISWKVYKNNQEEIFYDTLFCSSDTINTYSILY